MCRAFLQAEPRLLATDATRRPVLLRRGEALVMDSRVVHCGGANLRSVDRVLFYFSFCRGDSDTAAIRRTARRC